MSTINRLFENKGIPLNKQRFTWKELAATKPISKLDDDAFTRVRVILMNGIELDALRLKHIGARFHQDLRVPLAQIRRIEQHQATMINWLLSADHSPLETTIAYEQTAIEITAAVAQNEPDPYQAQVYRFGMLEDFDHLYRYSALLDRVEGKDANNILQSYTDIVPSRPTWLEHRAPEDDVRSPYKRNEADIITKIHAVLITAAEYQTHDYYMNVGPFFADPIARQLYAEIASMEEQHVTQYGSLADPGESFIEKWLIHEATEVYNYYNCINQENNPRIKALWERFLDYELGHLNYVCQLIQQYEKRDPQEILQGSLPEFKPLKHNRPFIRQVLADEVNLRANKTQFVPLDHESLDTLDYRNYINSEGVVSKIISAGYKWSPGTELNKV